MTLTIILAVCIALNLFLSRHYIVKIRAYRRRLQDRIDEFDELSEKHILELNGYKHRLSDAMSEVAHLRIQLNKKESELELLKKNGSGKRPTKKPSVNPDGNSTGGRQKGRVRGKRDTSGGIH